MEISRIIFFIAMTSFLLPTQVWAQNENLESQRQLFLNKINEYRASIGVPALKRWQEGEACADEQTKLDAEANKPHGHSAKCKQMVQNSCPNYPSIDAAYSVCLQQMWDEGAPPQPCDAQCYKKHGHYMNMANDDLKKVAIGFYTLPDGKVWVNMNFSRQN